VKIPLGCWSCRFVENHKGRLVCQKGYDTLERCDEFEYEPGSDEEVKREHENGDGV
jgi:hypothetical protein